MLLLGIFFISIGASLDFALIADRALAVTGIVLALPALKGLVLF